MKVIKKTKEYVVYQKASGRYAVKDANKNWPGPAWDPAAGAYKRQFNRQSNRQSNRQNNRQFNTS